MIEWWLHRTAHELDVLRTMAAVFGGALIPLLTFLLGWGIRLLRATRKDAAAAREQTAHTEYVNGQQRSVPVVDYARHAAHVGEANRQETTDLTEWVRGSGRRRLPTASVPRAEESRYE